MPKKLTREEFVDKAKKVHGDKYDYSKVEYVNNRTEVIIICPIHGEFKVIPDSHLRGTNCPFCGEINRRINKTSNLESWIKKAKKVHGDKYDYSKSIYNGATEPINIICPKHGEFIQRASDHLSGYGCKKCGYEKVSHSLSLDLEDIITKANEVHNNKYEYVISNNGTKNKINIVCPIHGIFKQRLGNHLYRLSECPKCANIFSKFEESIYNFLTENNIKCIRNDKSILNGLELDLLIPSHNIAIECNGLYWHSESFKDKNYHLNKTIECEKKGIRLIHIFEDEWSFKQNIVKSRLLNILGLTSNKIYARKCDLREVDPKECINFLDSNHIQGKCSSSIKIGLYFNNELVSLMTFGKSRHFIGNGKADFELLRFCNKLNTNVIGGASKLLKYFIKHYNPKEIISYADKRWSDGHLYEVLGFNHTHDSPPNYYYIIGQERKHRFNFRKSILIKKYGCPENLSEKKFCFSQNWKRIYDCGCMTYKLFFK
jgi:hypothetical protein